MLSGAYENKKRRRRACVFGSLSFPLPRVLWAPTYRKVKKGGNLGAAITNLVGSPGTTTPAEFGMPFVLRLLRWMLSSDLWRLSTIVPPQLWRVGVYGALAPVRFIYAGGVQNSFVRQGLQYAKVFGAAQSDLHLRYPVTPSQQLGFLRVLLVNCSSESQHQRCRSNSGVVHEHFSASAR